LPPAPRGIRFSKEAITMKRSLLSLALLAALSASPAFAADPDAEARLKALEDKVAALDAQLEAARAEINALKSAPVEATAAASADAPAAPDSVDSVAAVESADGDSGSAAASPNLMNPAISIILNGQYAHHSLDPQDFTRAGFPLAGESGPGAQGFSVGESEFSFAANIDEKFYGQVTFSVESGDGDDQLGLEEAYIETTALPNGLTLRAGRFLSNLGYLNHHHAHTDKFSDRPLASKAFLGGAYGDDGVQLRWVAPTDTFIELGGEVLRGQDESGLGARTLFAHVGGDVGSESSWLAGASMLDERTDGDELGFAGRRRLYIADGTWKWAPGGNTKDGGITLRGEYFVEHRDGDWTNPDDELDVQAWNGTRRGAYLEGVWRINRQWEAGYRYDRLWADEDGPFASEFDPSKHSLMLSWLNSEFSLFRLQLSREDANPDDSDTAVSLQYQTSLGAHGAHKF
jgi:hypothetical protein